jgi:hypothetical protein
MQQQQQQTTPAQFAGSEQNTSLSDCLIHCGATPSTLLQLQHSTISNKHWTI